MTFRCAFEMHDILFLAHTELTVVYWSNFKSKESKFFSLYIGLLHRFLKK